MMSAKPIWQNINGRMAFCPKCSGTGGYMKSGYKYHCYSCHHVESSTANTLSHKVKFGLQKAFCVVFEMTTSSKSLSSSTQLAEHYGISQTAMWFFMQKVRKAMESSKNTLWQIQSMDSQLVAKKMANRAEVITARRKRR